MNYIIFDLEWNQPYNKLPHSLEGEIIQIGAVKLNENFEKIDTFKMLVTPVYYTKLHRIVKELTNIQQEDLLYGFPFPFALSHFRKWCGTEFVLLAWGNDDLRLLKANMGLHHLNAKWIPAVYDLQLIFDRQIAMENRQCSLLYALEKLEKPALDAHDALHDALNTYAVLKSLDMEKSLAEYTGYLPQKNSISAKNHAAGLMAFHSRDLAFRNARKKGFYCPCCGQLLAPIEWVTQNSDKHITLADCECGREYFLRIRTRKTAKGNFRTNLSIYELNHDMISYYAAKRFKKIPGRYIQDKQVPLLPVTCSL